MRKNDIIQQSSLVKTPMVFYYVVFLEKVLLHQLNADTVASSFTGTRLQIIVTYIYIYIIYIYLYIYIYSSGIYKYIYI